MNGEQEWQLPRAFIDQAGGAFAGAFFQHRSPLEQTYNWVYGYNDRDYLTLQDHGSTFSLELKSNWGDHHFRYGKTGELLLVKFQLLRCVREIVMQNGLLSFVDQLVFETIEERSHNPNFEIKVQVEPNIPAIQLSTRAQTTAKTPIPMDPDGVHSFRLKVDDLPTLFVDGSVDPDMVTIETNLQDAMFEIQFARQLHSHWAFFTHPEKSTADELLDELCPQ